MLEKIREVEELGRPRLPWEQEIESSNLSFPTITPNSPLLEAGLTVNEKPLALEVRFFLWGQKKEKLWKQTRLFNYSRIVQWLGRDTLIVEVIVRSNLRDLIRNNMGL